MGIARTVLFGAFGVDCGKINRQVARIVASNPGQFLGFAFVHSQRDAGRIHELVNTAVNSYGFVGIKVHRHDAPISREVCEAARVHHIPILYDLAGEVATCELLAQEFPDVDFIIPHLGSFDDDWRAQLALIDHLVRHTNIHADSSGVRRFDLLLQAVRRAGAKKLIFGSDGPWLHPGVELSKIAALRLAPRDRALVEGGNLVRLLAKRRRFGLGPAL